MPGAGRRSRCPLRTRWKGVGQVPDVWSMVSNLDTATQERLADVLETRGADAQQQRMRDALLTDIGFPARARVLDVGCGTGVLTRRLARWPNVDSVVGVDLAPSLLGRARTLCAALPNVAFEEGDATALPFPDASNRKSTRLNSSHVKISYAVFCLKKKN